MTTQIHDAPTAPAGPDTGTLLSARGVVVDYPMTKALREIDLDIGRGEFVAITGPSGAGKSTLMLALAGVIRPTSGTVTLRGTPLGQLSEAERSRLRRTELGIVFQLGRLVDELTAAENVALPLLLAGVGRSEAIERAEEALGRLTVAEVAASSPPRMSPGQVQRVALARAMVTNPSVLFADEPTGALDSVAGEQVMTLIADAAREQNTTVVLVTHDARVAAYAEREVHLRDGRIVADHRGSTTATESDDER